MAQDEIVLSSSTQTETVKDVELQLSHDLEAVKRTLKDHFGERVSTIVLGGSFGRGEGCLWDRKGERVPGNNLNLFLITDGPLAEAELELAKKEILEQSLVESVVLTPFIKKELSKLPLTLETIDLQDTQRIVDGDPANIEKLPFYDINRFPRWEAEKLLRGRLVLLLEGYPQFKRGYHSFYASCKSIFASVDAYLIRNNCYTLSYRKKVERFSDLIQDIDLVRLVNHALSIKLGGNPPADYSPMQFWHSALRFHLDSFIGLLNPPGIYRPDRLRHLLGIFHYQTTSPKRTMRNLMRIFFHRNHRGSAERLLLGLAIDRDVESMNIDLKSLAHRAKIHTNGHAINWENLMLDAIDCWYTLRRLR